MTSARASKKCQGAEKKEGSGTKGGLGHTQEGGLGRVPAAEQEAQQAALDVVHLPDGGRKGLHQLAVRLDSDGARGGRVGGGIVIRSEGGSSSVYCQLAAAVTTKQRPRKSSEEGAGEGEGQRKSSEEGAGEGEGGGTWPSSTNS